MSFYLLRSEYDNEKVGDVIARLDDINELGFSQGEDKFFISVQVACHNYKFVFRTKESMLAEGKKLLSALGADPALVDQYAIYDVVKDKDIRQEMLKKKLSELLS